MKSNSLLFLTILLINNCITVCDSPMPQCSTERFKQLLKDHSTTKDNIEKDDIRAHIKDMLTSCMYYQPASDIFDIAEKSNIVPTTDEELIELVETSIRRNCVGFVQRIYQKRPDLRRKIKNLISGNPTLQYYIDNQG